MLSNMSTDVSFLRFDRTALVEDNREEISVLCVEEAVDQKPLALESVIPDGTFILVT